MIQKAHINRAQIKNYVVTKNVTCKFADMKNLFLEALNAIIEKNWKHCVQHVITKKYWKLGLCLV